MRLPWPAASTTAILFKNANLLLLELTTEYISFRAKRKENHEGMVPFSSNPNKIPPQSGALAPRLTQVLCGDPETYKTAWLYAAREGSNP
jgi:hypothetical protein